MYKVPINPRNKSGYTMQTTKRRNRSPLVRLLTSLASDIGLAVTITLVLLAVYLIDTVTPRGEPVWLLYFIPLVLSFWSERYYAIPTVCIVTLLFLVGGFLVSPQGIAIPHAILLRSAFFLVFIIISITLWAIRRRQLREDRL